MYFNASCTCTCTGTCTSRRHMFPLQAPAPACFRVLSAPSWHLFAALESPRFCSDSQRRREKLSRWQRASRSRLSALRALEALAMCYKTYRALEGCGLMDELVSSEISCQSWRWDEALAVFSIPLWSCALTKQQLLLSIVSSGFVLVFLCVAQVHGHFPYRGI